MKIYIITKGCYSDYHICTVTTDKEEAKALKEIYSDYLDEANIEEFDTNNNVEVIKYKKIYCCLYEKDISVSESGFENYYIPNKVYKTRYGMYVYVFANDKEMALKKASDIFSKYKAERMEL